MTEEIEVAEILTVCALRFDGYKYIQQNKFDTKKAVMDFFVTNRWDLQPREKLATFFFLQRSLYKYDLQYEPRDGKYHQAFCSLFFECVDLVIETEYSNKQYSQKWENEYKPNLEQIKTLIAS